MTIDIDTDPFNKHIYIPAYLLAIGYTVQEGDMFQKWFPNWGIVHSHRMPRGINDSIGNVKLQCTQLHLYHPELSTRIHCVLFEKGYMWDTTNGWRDRILQEEILDEIKSRWLFET